MENVWKVFVLHTILHAKSNANQYSYGSIDDRKTWMKTWWGLVDWWSPLFIYWFDSLFRQRAQFINQFNGCGMPHIYCNFYNRIPCVRIFFSSYAFFHDCEFFKRLSTSPCLGWHVKANGSSINEAIIPI